MQTPDAQPVQPATLKQQLHHLCNKYGLVEVLDRLRELVGELEDIEQDAWMKTNLCLEMALQSALKAIAEQGEPFDDE